MDALQAERAQVAWINELLHRMTVAETRDVRVQLCAQAKEAIDELRMMAAAGKQR
jgi:uncharacterized protein YgfB (UPF0149 family)